MIFVSEMKQFVSSSKDIQRCFESGRREPFVQQFQIRIIQTDFGSLGIEIRVVGIR
jgi:hypothetical protein